MKNNGWIKLHRKIMDSWIWEDPEKLRAWLDILLMVNHEDKKTYVNGNLTTIHRGEKLTSITKLAERWRWSKKRVMRFLDLLEEDGMCTTKRTTYGTTLKVSNYAKYQDFQTSKGNAVDTTNDTADVTAGVTAHDTQTINIKNDKEYIRTRARAKDHDPMNPAPKFNNSPQREYDMQELERILLRTN